MMKKAQLRRGIIVILAVIMVVTMLSACGGKSGSPEGNAPESTSLEASEEGEADDVADAEAEEESAAETEPIEEEPEVAKVVWVVEPTNKYQDIDQISSRSLKFQGQENMRIRRTCIANNKGYPQQWGEGIIPESDGGGTISYSPNAIAVARQDGYMQWGIIDYDGNVLLEPTHSPNYAGMSPFRTPGYVNIYGGIGYYSDTDYASGMDMFDILSGDYSTVVYSFNDVGGYGVPEFEYCIEDGKLYHLDSGYPTVEFSECDTPDVLKDTLVPTVPVSEWNGKADGSGGFLFSQEGYAYIDANGDIVEQKAYNGGAFVNGYYVGYKDKAAYEAHWHEDGVLRAIINAEAGEGITDFVYEDALYFEEGYCPVKRDGKWGFIDTSGTEVTEMIFDKVSTLYEGKVAAIIDGRLSIINLKETLDRGPLTAELLEKALAEIIAAKEEERANKESDLKFPEDFAGGYGFASGVGGWFTSITLHEDGTFEGSFHDTEMGSTGDDYPYGTVYYCDFSGKFVLKEETAYNVYSVELKDLILENEEGEERIEEGVKYIAVGPYGIERGEEFLFMGKGSYGGDLSSNAKAWLLMPMWMTQAEIESEEGLPRNILLNVNTEDVFAGIGE